MGKIKKIKKNSKLHQDYLCSYKLVQDLKINHIYEDYTIFRALDILTILSKFTQKRLEEIYGQ